MSEQIVCRLACFLAAGNFLADAVARRLPFLDRLDEPASFSFRRLRAIDDGSERVELSAAAHAFAKRVHLLPNHAQVVHFYLLGIPSAKDLNPQFGSITV